MRHLVVAACCLFLSVLVVAAPPPSDPEAVYRNYLSAIKASRSLDDRSFESYLSKTAQQNWADARLRRAKRTCDPCPSPEQELEMAKTMRPYPGAAVRPVRSESGGVVTLTYKWHEAPGSGSGIGTRGTDMTVKVELVQEQGWKLKSESWVMAESPGTTTMKASAAWSY